MDAVLVWLLGAMLAWSPPGAHARSIGSSRETEAQTRARYAEYVADLVLVTYDEAEEPLPIGPRDVRRAWTAATLLRLAWYESGFRRDVDLGPCRRGDCDMGLAWCTLQIHTGENGRTAEGWTGPDLERDRKKCLRAGLHIARRSFGACSWLPVFDRLSAYTSGACVAGEPKGRERLSSAFRWLGGHAPPARDAETLRDIRCFAPELCDPDGPSREAP